MAFFRCIQSGNMVEFTHAYDVETTRKQIMDYVETDKDGVPLKEEDKHHFAFIEEKVQRSKRKALEQAEAQ